MARLSGTEVVQVHLTTPYGPEPDALRNWVTWIESTLHPKVGMVLFVGADPTPWTVLFAYTGTPVRMEGINSGWKVGGLG